MIVKISFAKSLVLLIIGVIVTTSLPVSGQRGGRLCSILRNVLPDGSTCPSCSAGFNLFVTGIYVLISCDFVDTDLDGASGDLPPADVSFSGKYYKRGTPSTTKVTLKFSGDYNGFTIPPEKGTLIIVAKHKSPIDIANPIDFTSCSAKIGSCPCECVICNSNAGLQPNCDNCVLIPAGSGPGGFPLQDQNYPTTDTCIKISA